MQPISNIVSKTVTFWKPRKVPNVLQMVLKKKTHIFKQIDYEADLAMYRKPHNAGPDTHTQRQEQKQYPGNSQSLNQMTNMIRGYWFMH